MSSDAVGKPSPGKLIVVSGPSGAGKSTVLADLLKTCPLPLEMSVSATTRPPRPAEKNGIDYIFLSAEQFATRRENDDFLECFEVFGRGHWYGTLRETVATGLKAGKWVLLEIDVQGARKVVSEHPDAFTLFIHTGDLDELERRLRGRKTENEAAIASRLETARNEIAQCDWYQYVVINSNVPKCVAEICQILQQQSGIHSCTTK